MMDKSYISVAILNRYLKDKFDQDPHIQKVFLKGEISNFKGQSRGHLYFTLKDEEARISAVMFESQAKKLLFTPADGMKVLVEGRVSVYPATGAYQIYIENMEEDGLGNLYLKYEALKKELAAKGLFNQEHKKPLPKFPTKIGIVTAATGAAIKDILSTIKRRYPICETYLFPCLVQGDLAKDNIAEQIAKANEYDLDLLIVGRGGGSIEDLWAFNEEVVAYAIYNSNLPIISAVGHEIDTTIADYVADLRAPTPTGAAEIAVPNILDLTTFINQLSIRATKVIQNKLNMSYSKLESIKSSYVLTNPMTIYEIKEQKLTNLINNINNIMINKLKINKTKYEHLKKSYILNNPESLFKDKQNYFQLLVEKIELLNPLSILSKGYSVVSKDQKIIKDKKDFKIGDIIDIKLYQGQIKAKIIEGDKNGKEEI